MIIQNEIKLDFSDVLLRPKRSTLKSRADVSLVRNFAFKNKEQEWTGIPVMASNMETTGTFETALEMEKLNMLCCLHKNYDVEELYDFFFTPREYTAYSMGITEPELHKWNLLKSKLPSGNLKFVCIDVANGYTVRFVDFVRKFREENPNVVIIAGNVVTAEMTQELILNGADIVKVGVGSGSICTTRVQTGVGYPQLSAVIECGDAAHGLGGYVVSDGGCSEPGHIVKALAAGADFVMLGGMIAGHEESGGETLVEDGGVFKIFQGLSSDSKTVKIPFRGPLRTTLQGLIEGLRSGCAYIGAESIKQISKCAHFVRVNNNRNVAFEKDEI
mgnify:CR=1 FL=1